MLWDLTNSWKAFSASCRLWKHFPCKKSCQDAWRSGSQLARGQVNVADEAKLRSPICSTFEVTCGQTSCRRIRPFLLTNAVCRHCSFQCISSICWAYFSDVMGFDGIQKTLVDQISSRPTNHDRGSFCGAGLALGSALELLLGPATKLVIASCRIQSTFCCTWQSD